MENRLKILRKNRKKSQQQIADYLNISQVAYSKYETGKTEPSSESLLKLASFYNVSVDYLLGRDDKIQNYNEEKTPTNNVDAIKIQEILDAMKDAGMSDEKIKNITKEDIKLIAGIANEIVKNRK